MRILILLPILFLSITLSSAEVSQENLILSQVLKESYEDGGCTIVAPLTDVSHLSTKDFLKVQFKEQGAAIFNLIDQLYRVNAKPERLTLDSSPENGYIIDSQDDFNKYFKEDKSGGGWEKWYEDFPGSRGYTRVSLPAYDEESGLVLVYKGRQSHWLAGSGSIILYRYQDGRLNELKRVRIWIS